jgi:hypothetical protein
VFLRWRLDDAWHGICSGLARFNLLETAIVIGLDKFSNPTAAQATAQEHCGGEPMCADSTAIVEVFETLHYQQLYEPGPELPDDAASIDDAFLDRVRALASLI